MAADPLVFAEAFVDPAENDVGAEATNVDHRIRGQRAECRAQPLGQPAASARDGDRTVKISGLKPMA